MDNGVESQACEWITELKSRSVSCVLDTDFDDSPVLLFCQSLVLGCSSPRMFDVCYHDVSRFNHEFVSVVDGKSRRDIFNSIRKNIVIDAGIFFFCRLFYFLGIPNA